MNFLLAVCDGGSDTGATIVVLATVALYLVLAAWLIRGAEEGARVGLGGIFVLTALIGVAFLIGARYDDAFFGYVLIGVVIAVFVGGLLAKAMPGVGAGRALSVSVAGALMAPVIGIILVISAFLVGTACLE